MTGFTIEENYQIDGAKIKAIGVGGGGGNMINHMIREGVKGVEMIVANTDTQALRNSLTDTRIQLGERLTRGLGAGSLSEVGKEAAIESYEEIKSSLEGADIVFISAGMGGGTGTGAAPIVAKAAKEIGALTISIVTKPFRFEGRKRTRSADKGLEALKEESDSVIVIPNEKLLGIVEKTLGARESFKIVDKILSQAVDGMSSIILGNGESNINTDFADVKLIMSHKGIALMGVGEFEGMESALEAAKTATQSPLFDDMTINGAMGGLVHFHIHPDYPLLGISDAMDYVYDSVDEEADVIFGTTYDDTLPVDKVQVTIIATGFGAEELTELVSEASSVQQTSQVQEVVSQTPAMHTIKITSMDQVLGAHIGGAKVVGGDFDDDLLDIPPFMRNQLD